MEQMSDDILLLIMEMLMDNEYLLKEENMNRTKKYQLIVNGEFESHADISMEDMTERLTNYLGLFAEQNRMPKINWKLSIKFDFT